MDMLAVIAKRLKGARRLEIFILVAVVAAAVLMSMKTPGSGSASPMETRMERVLSAIEGAGRVKVLINENDEGGICGVLVVADGAGNLSVRMRLMSAVKATLGTDMSQVEIVEMEGSG